MGRCALLQSQREDVCGARARSGAADLQVHARAFAELIERQNIRPAPYLGHHNWVMLDRLDALRKDELQDLIRQSYEMVAAKAPGKSRGKRAAKKKFAGPPNRKGTR